MYPGCGRSKAFEIEYSFILMNIAKLRIDELILLRDKFMFHYENVKSKKFTGKIEVDILFPYGFIFIENASTDNLQEAYPYHYESIFKAYCYEHKLKRCIAITFTPTLTPDNKTTCHISWWISAEKQVIDELNSI